MALTKQYFTKSWTDSDDFPTYEESEDRVRADLQELHTQMQSYINGTLTEELDAALASKVPKAGLSMTASNNGDGTLTVALKLGSATLASCTVNIGEAQNITNTFITNELYVNYGWIADLMVNRLRTDFDRARRFLMSNKNALHYLDIHDEVIRFVTASTDGSSHSQMSYAGQLYWWTDESRTQLTTAETPYPAQAYDYAELTKMAFEFREMPLSGGGTAVVPVLALGAGTGSGENGKAYIYKDTSGLRIKYYTEGSGAAVSLELDNGGNVKKSLGGASGAVQAALVYSGLSVPASAWQPDGTWESYPYGAEVAAPGASEGMGGEVIFHPDDVKQYDLSPVAIAGAGKVTIYAASPPGGTVHILQVRAVF